MRRCVLRFCIDIPDAKAIAIIDAFAARHAYEEQVPGPDGTMIPNPQPKAVFLKERVLEYIRSSAKHAMVAKAARDGERTAAARIEQDTTW